MAQINNPLVMSDVAAYKLEIMGEGGCGDDRIGTTDRLPRKF